MNTNVTTPVVAKPEEEQAANRYTYTPRVDIHEDEKAYYVEAEMPGVLENAVDVKLEDGVLTILGRVEPRDFPGFKRVYSEYEVGNYERAFRITEEVDAEHIEARLANGVLVLTLPKREAAKPRRIEVKVA